LHLDRHLENDLEKQSSQLPCHRKLRARKKCPNSQLGKNVKILEATKMNKKLENLSFQSLFKSTNLLILLFFCLQNFKIKKIQLKTPTPSDEKMLK